MGGKILVSAPLGMIYEHLDRKGTNRQRRRIREIEPARLNSRIQAKDWPYLRWGEPYWALDSENLIRGRSLRWASERGPEASGLRLRRSAEWSASARSHSNRRGNRTPQIANSRRSQHRKRAEGNFDEGFIRRHRSRHPRLRQSTRSGIHHIKTISKSVNFRHSTLLFHPQSGAAERFEHTRLFPKNARRHSCSRLEVASEQGRRGVTAAVAICQIERSDARSSRLTFSMRVRLR